MEKVNKEFVTSTIPYKKGLNYKCYLCESGVAEYFLHVDAYKFSVCKKHVLATMKDLQKGIYD